MTETMPWRRVQELDRELRRLEAMRGVSGEDIRRKKAELARAKERAQAGTLGLGLPDDWLCHTPDGW